MRVRELLLLAEGLKEIQKAIDDGVVDEDVFNMDDWRMWDGPELDVNKKGFDCGFAGCAIGWAPKFIPNFPFLTSDVGSLSISFADIATYFGIKYEESHELFGSDSYRDKHSPDLVSQRIYDVVRRHVNE